MKITFLTGVLPERNEQVIHELDGHVSFVVREPDFANGEIGMSLLRDGEVVAQGFNEALDFARGCHTLHVRARHAPELLPSGVTREMFLVGI